MVTFEKKVLPESSGVKFWTEDQEYRYPGGATVAVCGLDDPEKIKSTEFDVIYVQEATELEQLDWELLVSRLRNGVLSYQQLIADCNPADPYHWLKQRCDRGECLLLDTRHEDNPVLFDHNQGDWTVFGREYLRTLDTLTGYTYQRLRLGLWVAADGMFFTEWNPEKHIGEAFEVPESWPRWVSVDYGYAAPWCALWFTRNPETREVWVYRERYQSGLRDEEQAEEIKRAEGEGERIVARVLDPSMFNSRGEQQRPSIAQVYANAGLGGLVAGFNNRVQGWAVVRRGLAGEEPRVRVMRGRAPNLERCLPAMVHDPLDPEDVADKLRGQKTEDHAVDAFRYGLCAEAEPGGRDEDVVEMRWG
jgi:phage terminase large subunit